MSDLELRDHSQPCEHPSEDIANGYAHAGAWFDDFEDKAWYCDEIGCPGGKKIVLPKFLVNGVNDYSYELGPGDLGWYADPKTGEDTFPVEMYRVWVNGDPAEYREVSDE